GEDGDGRTPLDKTIDRIGMGSYQWTLLALCGFGWMADNMWIQAIAIILPRVQQHYAIPDSYIGIVSSSMFAGMMIGAIGWGTCSDILGRSMAFNGTLFFTALFGIIASLATTFPMLCIALFFLGSAVGGSMPTDGTLLLEHMPHGKEYLVTALSVFFSFGAVLSALVAIALIPSHSCLPAPAPCDLAENQGWRYELVALGLLTLFMFLARMVLFRLYESPRYLVHAGRPYDAIQSLEHISRFNGSELKLDLEDVIDHIEYANEPSPRAISRRPSSHEESPLTGPTIFDAEAPAGSPDGIRVTRPPSPLAGGNSSSSDSTPAYSATGESNTGLGNHSFVSPAPTLRSLSGLRDFAHSSTNDDTAKEAHTNGILDSPPIRPRPQEDHRRNISNISRRSSLAEIRKKVWWRLPRFIRKPFSSWFEKFSTVLSPEWIKTTILVWMTWFGTSLAYTMFNVYLPKLLETRSVAGSEPKSLEGTLWDVVIFTIGGCPGAMVGAWLIESPLGRRLSLAGSTFITAFFCFVFVMVDGQFAITASTVGISLSATTMWAVLYGWTPEIFSTNVRGTACGAASALSRIGGMIAPILGGTLLMVDISFPVFASIGVFALSGMCVLFLHEGAG
ncbi:major facilitator superfamily domain-containing protein, partial [Vararia minispora EC-137]